MKLETVLIRNNIHGITFLRGLEYIEANRKFKNDNFIK